jgi:chromate transporter
MLDASRQGVCMTTGTVPFRQALRFWLKLGFISFGGPAGQISIMHQELVERRRWLSEGRFLHAVNYCMVLPGPEAQQLATYIGWLMHRTWGGIAAGALFVLPSFFILCALSWVYLAYGHVPLVAGVFYGIKPAVTAIVLQAAIRIGGRTLKHPVLWVVAATALAAISLGVPFPAIVLGAAIIGFLGGRYAPAAFRGGAHKSGGASPAAHLPALIDDATPVPEHARFRWARLWIVVSGAMALWAVPMLGLAMVFGSHHTLSKMGWFFTKAALLTFGGAYAVLPYVYQGAVDQHAWLSATQMIDGLALGETTPGPLIMVVTFVGFVGGYQGALLGAEHVFLAGVLAATVVTWFTFLPSFLFILAGGPAVESTRGDIKLAAPLTAISAAVVGAIVGLTLFFAAHVFWPAGFPHGFDAFAAALALAAAIALIRFKRGVMEVIALCGLIGCLRAVLG